MQTDRIIRERGNLLYLVTGNDSSGQPAYYYILVDKPKLQPFLAAFTKDDLELTDYGRIIQSGYGEHPPQDVEAEIKKKYGS